MNPDLASNHRNVVPWMKHFPNLVLYSMTRAENSSSQNKCHPRLSGPRKIRIYKKAARAEAGHAKRPSPQPLSHWEMGKGLGKTKKESVFFRVNPRPIIKGEEIC